MKIRDPKAPEHKVEYDQIKDMTGRQIIKYVEERTGITIKIPLKNKLGIIKRAIGLLKGPVINPIDKLPPKVERGKSSWTKVFPKERFIVDLNELDKSQLCKWAKDTFGENIAGYFNWCYWYKRSTLVKRLIKLCREQNAKYGLRYIVKNQSEIWKLP
jgi:hypothetical protein